MWDNRPKLSFAQTQRWPMKEILVMLDHNVLHLASFMDPSHEAQEIVLHLGRTRMQTHVRAKRINSSASSSFNLGRLLGDA